MQTIFVTGTDTNIGKTYVSCLLIRKLRATGLTIGAYKPVCSGAEFDADGRPAGPISRHCGLLREQNGRWI